MKLYMFSMESIARLNLVLDERASHSLGKFRLPLEENPPVHLDLRPRDDFWRGSGSFAGGSGLGEGGVAGGGGGGGDREEDEDEDEDEEDEESSSVLGNALTSTDCLINNKILCAYQRNLLSVPRPLRPAFC